MKLSKCTVSLTNDWTIPVQLEHSSTILSSGLYTAIVHFIAPNTRFYSLFNLTTFIGQLNNNFPWLNGSHEHNTMRALQPPHIPHQCYAMLCNAMQCPMCSLTTHYLLISMQYCHFHTTIKTNEAPSHSGVCGLTNAPDVTHATNADAFPK